MRKKYKNKNLPQFLKGFRPKEETRLRTNIPLVLGLIACADG